jgi:ribosome-associated translation inhibitor RaiA
MHVANPGNVDPVAERKTFFYNALHVKHKVNTSRYQNDFCIDQHYHFKCDSKQTHKHTAKMYYAVDEIEVGSKNEIPLWLFGFLY